MLLAGGLNTRFPVQKGFIKLNGKTIADKTLKILRKYCSEVFISTNRPELYFVKKTPLFADIINVRGPLTGILTGLINASFESVIFVACDMPFIKEELVNHLVSSINSSSSVVPVNCGKPEPLLAVYKKKLAPSIYNGILSGNKSARDYIKSLTDVKFIDVQNIDPEGVSFYNINTMVDLQKINLKYSRNVLST